MSPLIAPPVSAPAASAAARPVPVDAPGRAVVVGAGPVGMATAIELAQRGVPSVVLEKRGPQGTRENLFNVAPPLADRLAALDPQGSLTRLLVPTERMVSEDHVTSDRGERRFHAPMQPDAARSRGDMGALARALGSPKHPDADTRRWSKVGIGDLENAMRELARSRHGDLVEFRTGADVQEIRQGADWVEAVLRAPEGGGAADAVRGAVLIDASGSDLLASPRKVYPERSHWIGGRFAAPADGSTATLRRRAPDPRDGGAPAVTISLPSADRTMVWAQVREDAKTMPPERRAALLEQRAAEVGTTTPLADRTKTAPVTVQLWESTEPARGRVLKVGDSLRAPYFPTSSGAATGIVHDAPRAVDAAVELLSGRSPRSVAASYADAVRAANAQLVAVSRGTMLADLGIDPAAAGPPAIVHSRTAPTPGASPHAA